jgi:arylsulfatase A-like enzyme
VAECDHYLGELVAALRERGLWDDALVVLTADHGEGLGEHSFQAGGRVRYFWEHGYSQYQSEVHVPLILRWPGRLPANVSVPGTAPQVGLKATLLELLKIPLQQKAQGPSLVGHVVGAPATDFAFTEALKFGQELAVLEGDWKLMVRWVRGASPGQHSIHRQLYNLQNDPNETADVSRLNATVTDDLEQRLREILEECKTLKPEVVQRTRTLSPEEMRNLEALGYTGGPTEPADGPDETPGPEP